MKRVVSYCALLLVPVLGSLPLSATTFTYTGAVQTYTAANTGVYQIISYGAQGGGSSLTGGLGAEIGGYFTLTAGEMVSIAVGGGGQFNSLFGGAGGGGTFIVAPGGVPLVVAGGGGGSNGGTSGSNASTGTSGISAGAAGGTNGSGGVGSTGGGGAGFSGAGGNGIFGQGGSDYAQGLAGGQGYGAAGGFGGGGGSGEEAGGGGGGYSGGGGGYGPGGGGGSYLDASATNRILLAGVVSPDGSANGYASILAIPSAPPTTVTPEPAGVLLLGTGLLSMGQVVRRRFNKAPRRN